MDILILLSRVNCTCMFCLNNGQLKDRGGGNSEISNLNPCPRMTRGHKATVHAWLTTGVNVRCETNYST